VVSDRQLESAYVRGKERKGFWFNLDNALEGLKMSQMRCSDAFDFDCSVCEAERF